MVAWRLRNWQGLYRELAEAKNISRAAVSQAVEALVQRGLICRAIPRFYDATRGRILIDGHDIRQVRQDSLLGCIAVVPQETVLFSGTVRENIRFGHCAPSQCQWANLV